MRIKGVLAYIGGLLTFLILLPIVYQEVDVE